MIEKIIAIGLIFLSSVTFAAGEKKMNTREQAKQPKVQFVVFHKPGPKWQAGVDFRQQPGVKDHVVHYMKFHDEGRLALGGPFLDGSGGMMVAATGETQESVSKFAAEDPAVKSGLLIFEVRPWLIAMEKENK